MLRIVTWTGFAAAVVFVAVLVLGGAIRANAATGPTMGGSMVLAADTVPLPPGVPNDPYGYRKWMLNTLSRVLGSAMPDKYKREQITRMQQYDHGWEQWMAEHNMRSVDWEGSLASGHPVYNPLPGEGTYTDSAIAQLDSQFRSGNAATGKGAIRKISTPATRAVTFLKTVDGAGLAMTAYPVGSFLGTGAAGLIGQWAGFDANSLVCSNYHGDLTSQDGSVSIPGGGDFIRMLSGQDCTAFDLDHAYTPNIDADGTLGTLCGVGQAGASGTVCVTFVKTIDDAYYRYWCYHATTTSAHDLNGVYVRTSSGSWNPVTLNAPFGAAWITVVSTCGGGTTNALLASPTGTNNGLASPIGMLATDSTGTNKMTVTQADPDRTLTCTVTYTDGTTDSATSSTFKESGPGGLPPAPCPPSPDNKVPNNVTVKENTIGGTKPPAQLFNQPTTPEYQNWRQNYPECATGACKLDLVQQATGNSCFDLEHGCPGWWSDPNKSTVYQCQYGTGPGSMHNVDIEECAAYAGLFEPGRITAGAPYSDPKDGTWSGGQNSPTIGSETMGQGLQDPSGPRSCSLDFNPVRWIQCAMEWTFVARPTVAAVSFASVQDVWETKPPGQIIEAAQNVHLSGAATGCSITVNFFGYTGDAINACGGQMAIFAGFTRLAGLAIMGVMVFAKVRRQIAAMVNYNVGQD